MFMRGEKFSHFLGLYFFFRLFIDRKQCLNNNSPTLCSSALEMYCSRSLCEFSGTIEAENWFVVFPEEFSVWLIVLNVGEAVEVEINRRFMSISLI